MVEINALANAAIELAAWLWGHPNATALEAREHARAIAWRDLLGLDDARRLVRIADAMRGPLAAEDE